MIDPVIIDRATKIAISARGSDKKELRTRRREKSAIVSYLSRQKTTDSESTREKIAVRYFVRHLFVPCVILCLFPFAALPNLHGRACPGVG